MYIICINLWLIYYIYMYIYLLYYMYMYMYVIGGVEILSWTYGLIFTTLLIVLLSSPPIHVHVYMYVHVHVYMYVVLHVLCIQFSFSLFWTISCYITCCFHITAHVKMCYDNHSLSVYLNQIGQSHKVIKYMYMT